MRELKFRARINEKGRAKHLAEWQYFTLEEAFFHHGLWECIDPETIGQFIDLHDKARKEIYEGDIISYGYYEDSDGNDDLNRPMTFSVKWSQNDCGFTANGRLIPHDGWIYGGDMYPFKVIGNIYEAPA